MGRVGWARLAAGAVVLTVLLVMAATCWDDCFEKRVAVVQTGCLVRGAWQRPAPLRRVIHRERIRTIVTLTAINRDDPKYVSQERVVRETGVRWILLPLHGSRATLDQMAEAADLLADVRLQPIFFHCVAGHHRTSLIHAAYRMRHQGWTPQQAWRELAALPWSRPLEDLEDRRLIEEFAAKSPTLAGLRKDSNDEAAPHSLGRPVDYSPRATRSNVPGVAVGIRELRRGGARASLPLGPIVAHDTRSDSAPARDQNRSESAR